MFGEFLNIVFKSIKLDRSLYTDNKNFGEASVYFAGLIMILDGIAGAVAANTVIKTAVAIAKACTLIENMECVVSLRAGAWLEGMTKNKWNYDDKPIMLIAYDSRRQGVGQLRLFSHLAVCGGTPEGLCFSAIMDEILDLSLIHI